MPEHQTYSLNTLLTSRQIKPQIYKHIIHEIKSPLQQQSFQLTNDDSNNSHVFQKMPKRPNIPPAPSKSPISHFQNNQFSRTYESLSEDLHLSKWKCPEEVKGNEVESFVSPLQYEVNSKEYSQNNFCGAFDSILKINDMTQVLLPTKSKSGKRKPIFQKKQHNKPLKTLDQALSKLIAINQSQLVFFLQLMGELQKQLSKLLDHRDKMESQLPFIFQRLAIETHHSPHGLQSSQAYSKILQRLKSKNAGQVIKKLFKKDEKKQKLGEALLQKLFQSLSSLQTIINQFIKKEHSLQYLSQAFEFIMQNFQKQTSFKAQLSRFYESLSIDVSTNGLQLIWNNCGERILSKTEFIQSLTLNSFVVREKQEFEDVLLQKGFVRNEY